MVGPRAVSTAVLILLNFLYLSCPAAPASVPSMPAECSKDGLKFGVCGDWLGGLAHEEIGAQPSSDCCTVLKGVADLEAALCLCTAVKANVLGALNLNIPIALTLVLNSCGKKLPDGFVC